MNEPWFVHHVIYRRLTFHLEYQNVSPLRIGAGKAVIPTSPVDLQVVTIKLREEDVPFIPGSSLKGVFRSASEFLANSVGLNVCMNGEGCKSKYDNDLQRNLRMNNLRDVVNVLGKYCLICKLYGSGSYSSHTYFSDAYPLTGETPLRGVKTGIAIDRRSGTVKRGALYTVEFVIPYSKFKGTVTFTNVPNYGLGLFAYILSQINEGLVKIGGFKSRGFGEMKIKPQSIDGLVLSDGIYKDITEVKTLASLDEKDEEVKIDIENPENFLKDCEKVWWNYVKKCKS